MIKVFQIIVGVGTESFYEAHTAEEAVKKFKKDYIEEFGGEPGDEVDAILYDEYEDW